MLQRTNATAATQPPQIAYSWLRNDRPIPSRSAHLAAFANGTLRLTHAKIATGRFRCVANDVEFSSGAIVSTASHVQQAGELCADNASEFVYACAIIPNVFTFMFAPPV